ncbi:MAG: phage head morphogenesis protein [Arcobacter sp.]|nr:MAG: phage head morphogenesis protein [Arcobacter sp.]
MVKLDFTKPPEEIINYLKNKGFKLTFDYDEMIKEAHHKTFTVAKVTRADLLNDIHGALTDALKDGKNFKQFKKDILPTLKKKGWWGEQEIINPKTGEIKKVLIGSRRLKTIFDTNMRVAYQQYRYKQMMQLPLSTYWMYRSALLENTREKHRDLHRTVLPRDHSFWSTNYPPNDWNCKCSVTAHSEKDLEKRGLNIYKGKIKGIASKDWAYNVGDISKVSTISKLDLSSSLAALTTLKSIKNNALKDMSEEDLKKRFYKTLAIKEADVFIDKINDPIIIDDNLFKAASGHSKIKKRDRHLYLDEIAKTIKDPDEIYLEYAKGKITKENRLIKKMFRYYNDNGKRRAILVIFEYLKDKTQGVTAYFLDNGTQMDKRRIEKLIYKRESD